MLSSPYSTSDLLLRWILSDDRRRIEVQQFPKLESAGMRQLLQRRESNVDFPPGFQCLVVLVFKAGTLGKRLLAEAKCLPEFPDSRQQALRRFVCHGGT